MIEISAGWDWVTPCVFWVQGWLYPSVLFYAPRDCGLSAWEIKRMLAKSGVRVHGLLVTGDSIVILVREKQARYAAFRLEQMGVPFESSTPKLTTKRKERL